MKTPQVAGGIEAPTIDREPMRGTFEGTAIEVGIDESGADSFYVAIRTTSGRYVRWGTYHETPYGIFAMPNCSQITNIPVDDDCDAWRTIIRLGGSAA